MDSRARTLPALAAIAAACVAGPPGAGAAVTIGSTTDDFNNLDQCSVNQSQVQAVNPHGGRNYIAPSSGVITSWQHRDGTEAGVPTLRLKVYAPVGNPATTTTWNLRSHSAAKSGLTSNALNTIQESPGIPIEAGDHLGLTALGGAAHVACLSFTGGTGGLRRSNGLGGGDTAIGNNTFADSAPDTGVDVAATIEPDADGDHFGDETQDQCTTDPTTQGPCQANLSITKVASPQPVIVGNDLTYTITITNTSAFNTASNVVVNDTLPSGATFKSSTTSQGTCTGTTAIACNLGLLGAGATATVVIVVTPSAAGALSNTATVTSSTPDPSAANNSSTATSTVNPPADGGGGDGGGGGGDGGGGGGDGGGGGGTDAIPPIGTLDGKSKQDVDKLALTVSSNEAGTVSGQATVNASGAKRPVTSKPATGSVPANGTLKLRFKFKKSSLKKIKKTIAKGKQPKAKVTVTITDGAGNATTLNKSVKLKN